jgi:hypothetical protein
MERASHAQACFQLNPCAAYVLTVSEVKLRFLGGLQVNGTIVARFRIGIFLRSQAILCVASLFVKKVRSIEEYGQ